MWRIVVVSLLLAAPAHTAPPKALDARTTAAAAAYEDALVRFQAGRLALDDVYVWSRRWYDAGHGRGDAAAGTEHAARMAALGEVVRRQVAAGVEPTSDELALAWYLADAAVLAGG